MDKIVIANLKMKLKASETSRLLKAFQKLKKDKSWAVAPDFLSLEEAVKKGFLVVAQNCAPETEGALTGEVSPLSLKKKGVKMVILGHSERRQFFGESDELVARKAQVALQAGLEPIICVGEKSPKEDWQKEIDRQLKASLRGLSKDKMITIAYEPVWAIGSGQVCLPDRAEKVHLFIEKKLKTFAFKKFRIIYGGSVNEKNSASFADKKGISGLLVGGASLSFSSFKKIIKDFYV